MENGEILRKKKKKRNESIEIFNDRRLEWRSSVRAIEQRRGIIAWEYLRVRIRVIARARHCPTCTSACLRVRACVRVFMCASVCVFYERQRTCTKRKEQRDRGGEKKFLFRTKTKKERKKERKKREKKIIIIKKKKRRKKNGSLPETGATYNPLLINKHVLINNTTTYAT